MWKGTRNTTIPNVALLAVGACLAATGCGPAGQAMVPRDGGPDVATAVDTAVDTMAADLPKPDDAGQSSSDARDTAPPPTDGATVDTGGGCFPACILDVGKDCPRLGQECLQTMLANGDVVQCSANGVKAYYTQATTTVKKANGAACFQIVKMPGRDDYVDPNGTVVAGLETVTSTRYVVRCADGTAIEVDLMAPECAATVAAMRTCSAGACAW